MCQLSFPRLDSASQPSVRISDHDYAADAPWYAEYRRIKYEVFTSEMGWDVGGSEESPLASPDPFDAVASFSLMHLPDAGAIGTIRGCRVTRGFPHRDFFAEHMRSETFRAALPHLCTLNALAVLPGFRKRLYFDDVREWHASAGRLLVLSQLRYQQSSGVCAAVLTAGGPRPARFFARLGFHPIDRPGLTPLYSGRLMNMALWFHDNAYANALADAGIEVPCDAPSAVIEAFREYVMNLRLNTNTDAFEW